MEATIGIADKRFYKAIDMVCTIMIGIGLGGLGMYWYAVSHPQDIIQAQSHILIAPQDTSATSGADKKSNTVPKKAAPITIQI